MATKKNKVEEEMVKVLQGIRKALSSYWDLGKVRNTRATNDKERLYWEGYIDGLGKARIIVDNYFEIYMEKGGFYEL